MSTKKKDLRGLRVLVTAGPTREYIDPVRFLSNPSTGRMGYALAAAAQGRGAQVTLISGPTELPKPRGVKVIDVVSAAEMYRAAMKAFPKNDLIFKAAAVADYRPAKSHTQKMKKGRRKTWKLPLIPTRDILATLGRRKKATQFLVGFAAETDHIIHHAREKLEKKNLDLIVVNDVRKKESGFASSANQVSILYADGRQKNLPRMSKERLAEKLLILTLRELITR